MRRVIVNVVQRMADNANSDEPSYDDRGILATTGPRAMTNDVLTEMACALQPDSFGWMNISGHRCVLARIVTDLTMASRLLGRLHHHHRNDFVMGQVAIMPRGRLQEYVHHANRGR